MESYSQYNREELIQKIKELEKQIEDLSLQNQQQTDVSSSYNAKYGEKILKTLPDMLSVIDYQGTHIDIVSSEKTVHVGASSSASLRGKNIREILPPDAYESVKENLERAIQTQDTSIGFHSLTTDGVQHFFENRMIPLDHTTILSICRDITDSVKTQQELNLVRLAVNNSIEEIFAATPEGKLIFANKKFLNHYHLSENISDHKIYDIYPQLDVQAWAKQVATIRSQGNSWKYMIHRPEPDGKTTPLEIATFIIRNPEGQETIWAFGRDVSEQLQQQEKINELNSLMRIILNNVPVYLFVKDTGNNFRYLYWNKAFEQFSHIPASKVLGKTDTEIFPNLQDAQKFMEDDLRLMADGSSIEYQEEYTTALGERRMVNTFKSLVPVEGKPPLLIGISWDITEIKQTEQELIQARQKAEQSDKLKSAFLANMSHEIRTPLNAIVGFSKLIADTKDSQERQEYYAIVDKNAEILLQLINDILDLSRIEAGTLEFIKKPTRLKELCRSLSDSLQFRNHPDVKLIFEESSADLITITDSNRISQVLTNLITNAQKFTTAGEIRFGYQILENRMIEFYVKDTGIGIAPENLNKIFNRFIKLNNFAQGTGLGLSICQMIVETLGGEIKAESQAGKGSVFRFTIPYDSGNLNKPQAPQRAAGPASATPVCRATILIAEDVDSNYQLLTVYLAKHYELIRARNGKEAVQLFQEKKPDLILMDIKMPEMNGLEATQLIRQQSAQVPIIALSAYAFDSDREASIEAGCNDFLAKPVSLPALRAMIEKYLK